MSRSSSVNCRSVAATPPRTDPSRCCAYDPRYRRVYRNRGIAPTGRQDAECAWADGGGHAEGLGVFAELRNHWMQLRYAIGNGDGGRSRPWLVGRSVGDQAQHAVAGVPPRVAQPHSLVQAALDRCGIEGAAPGCALRRLGGPRSSARHRPRRSRDEPPDADLRDSGSPSRPAATARRRVGCRGCRHRRERFTGSAVRVAERRLGAGPRQGQARAAGPEPSLPCPRRTDVTLMIVLVVGTASVVAAWSDGSSHI